MSSEYEVLESRIAQLEECLGNTEFVDIKSVPRELEQIEQTIRKDLDGSKFLDIPLSDLKKLDEIASGSSSLAPLSKKVEEIQFWEDLIRQRVDLIQQFESSLKNALDTKDIEKVTELNADLHKAISDVETLRVQWRRQMNELNDFRYQYRLVLEAIGKRVSMLTTIVRTKITQKQAE